MFVIIIYEAVGSVDRKKETSRRGHPNFHCNVDFTVWIVALVGIIYLTD